MQMQFGNELSATASRLPPYRWYDVIYDSIAGHENVYASNSSQNRGGAVGEVSLCLFCKDAWTEMQYGLPGLSSDQAIQPDEFFKFYLIWHIIRAHTTSSKKMGRSLQVSYSVYYMQSLPLICTLIFRVRTKR